MIESGDKFSRNDSKLVIEETEAKADIEETEIEVGVQAPIDRKIEVVVVKDQAQLKEPTKFEDGEKWLAQQGNINSDSMEQQTIVYHRHEVTPKFLNVVDICEKLKKAYAMAFVNKIVIVNEPYGFRLLVMGSDDYMKMIERIEKIRARNIVLESKYGFSKIVNSDVTMAGEVELEVIVENIRAKLVRETTAKMNNLAGKGTTTSFLSQGMNAEDVNHAISTSRKAFDKRPWPKMITYERSHIMLHFADLLEKHTTKVVAFETWDTGKHYEQAANIEIPMVVCMFRYYANWAGKIHGLTIPADGQHHVQTLHEPYGVTSLIIPWNFPLLLYSWKVGPTLACGNTVVLKIVEQTPLLTLYVSKLFYKAGLPLGALNVVFGFGLTVGAALFSHMDVNKLSFTGSTSTGKIVFGLAAKSNFKPVTLELGRKFPFIVCKDTDVDKAVELARFALFFM
ncbi:hypothetical protein CRYUN_Cryun28dG0006200 [Craigia yunnanensis]